jgi:hypothetical protein
MSPTTAEIIAEISRARDALLYASLSVESQSLAALQRRLDYADASIDRARCLILNLMEKEKELPK